MISSSPISGISPDERLPVLILSAKGTPEDKVEALSYGVDDYLSKPFNLEEFLLRVERLLKEQKKRERELESLKAKLLSSESGDLLEGIKEVSGTNLLAREVRVESPKELRDFADRVKEKLQSGVIVLGSKNAGKALLICVVTKDLQNRYHAGKIISGLSEIVGGKGGGRKDMAQGGGSKPEALGQALESVAQMIEATA